MIVTGRSADDATHQNTPAVSSTISGVATSRTASQQILLPCELVEGTGDENHIVADRRRLAPREHAPGIRRPRPAWRSAVRRGVWRRQRRVVIDEAMPLSRQAAVPPRSRIAVARPGTSIEVRVSDDGLLEVAALAQLLLHHARQRRGQAGELGVELRPPPARVQPEYADAEHRQRHHHDGAVPQGQPCANGEPHLASPRSPINWYPAPRRVRMNDCAPAIELAA